MARTLYITDLPTYVILEILRYLDSTSLYLLGRASVHFDDIIKSNATLWRRIDARRAPNDADKLSYCRKRCNQRSHTFLIRADHAMETLITDEFFRTIKYFKNLAIVAVENQKIDGDRYRAIWFPAHLHELSLKKTVVTNASHFFKESGEKLVKLRVLILDECSWLTSSAFMPISKYPSLEVLSVYKCRNIENSIAYLSLSGQGFKRLKIFDGRLSPLGNTLIRSLYKSPSLLAIYLQNEDVSYKLDYYKRKLEIEKGAPTRDFFVKDSEFHLDDSLTNEEKGLNYESAGDLDDRGLLDYVSAYTQTPGCSWPESVLYLDPYNRCACGFEERQKNIKEKRDKDLPQGPKNGDDDSDDSDDQGGGGDLPVFKKLVDKVSRLTRVVRQSQSNNSFSRGLSNHNHPRSPNDARTMFTIHNINTIHKMYRSVNDSENNVCLLDLASLQPLIRAERNEPQSPQQGVSRSRLYEVMVETYMPGMSSQQSNQDNTKPEENGGAQARLRDLPPRKRFKRSSASEPGPSGLNEPVPKKAKREAEPNSDSDDEMNVPIYLGRPPTPHPVANSPPPEKREAYRRIYFGHWPVIQIENLHDIRKEVPVPLKRLSLRGYKKITNVTLDYIKDLDLELLDLTYTNVSVNAINNYLVDHPFCRIVHERFCVCPTNLHF